jgi:hypothetical protein
VLVPRRQVKRAGVLIPISLGTSHPRVDGAAGRRGDRCEWAVGGCGLGVGVESVGRAGDTTLDCRPGVHATGGVALHACMHDGVVCSSAARRITDMYTYLVGIICRL